MDTALKGEAALVTGASGGIGAAVAQAFATEGCSVGLHYYRNMSAARNLGEDIERECNVRAVPIAADLRREADADRMLDKAIGAFGKVDHLVVNAGAWVQEDIPLHEMSLEQWRETLDADLTSAFLSCRAFFRHLKEVPRDEASVTLVASTAALFGEAGHCDYSAAKAAMAYGLTRSLKNEIVDLAVRGRVNCVCPGWVRTPSTEELTRDAEHVRRATSTMALQKIATADDIARAVVCLASPRLSGHVSGTIQPVAGGMEGRLLHPR